MADRRNPERAMMLWPLLQEFAKNQGIVSADTIDFRSNLVDTAKRLNRHLKELFGIDEKVWKHHYRVHKRYEARIFFSDQTMAS